MEAIDKELQGSVVIQFIISSAGKIEEPQVYQSVNIYLDKEAMRMITQSPDWIPGFQYGRNVKSYKRQPVTFRLVKK